MYSGACNFFQGIRYVEETGKLRMTISFLEREIKGIIELFVDLAFLDQRLQNLLTFMIFQKKTGFCLETVR